MQRVIEDGHIRLSDWLQEETQSPTFFCREEGDIEAGSEVRTGAMLGKVTATGQWAPYDPDATDGTQTLAGFLITDYLDGDTVAAQPGVILSRGPAAVKEAGLRWPTNADAGDKTTALAALAAKNIIVRQSA